VVLALPCDKNRRAYALAASALAMGALAVLMHAPGGRSGPSAEDNLRTTNHELVQDMRHEGSGTQGAVDRLPGPVRQALALLEAFGDPPSAHIDNGESRTSGNSVGAGAEPDIRSRAEPHKTD
jgi:hypothetical protein